ncbi:UNKNOWN [Stylonychia lemnae]|uniref:Protein kinase domain containing protein n=1 Tax=Stylonychia lemnae TaxID=5949 RepID=A0A078A1J5_STYLE|nr:UNKNOWN [Stylonychia lemnae]|eukprot:CDW75717.1 UNKNOWN [Stylonychia lemnae]
MNLTECIQDFPKYSHPSKETQPQASFRSITQKTPFKGLYSSHYNIAKNILIGYKDPAKIYLIDFGLSQPFVDFNSGFHVQKQNLSYFSGNFMFASLNSCRGNNKSRRDDIESVFYLMIYLYNNNFLPWRDFQECLEDCLKYVLLLNFEEEPKYDYLIEQLKNAYTLEIFNAGLLLNINCFKSPVFEWNVNKDMIFNFYQVSLATRFTKAQTQLDSQWAKGEVVQKENLDVISTSLMKSKIFLNLSGSNYELSHGSAQINLDNSPMSADLNMMSNGDMNLNSDNLRVPGFKRNGSVGYNRSQKNLQGFSKFKPQNQNRQSHSPQQQRHFNIDKSRLQPKSSQKFENLNIGQYQDDGYNSPCLNRKSSFFGKAQKDNQRKSSFRGKSNAEEKVDKPTAYDKDNDAIFSDENLEEDRSYESLSNEDDFDDVKDHIKQDARISSSDILVQQLENQDFSKGMRVSEMQQTSQGEVNISSKDLDEQQTYGGNFQAQQQNQIGYHKNQIAQPPFRVMKVNQNDLRSKGGSNSPQLSEHHLHQQQYQQQKQNEDAMMID